MSVAKFSRIWTMFGQPLILFAASIVVGGAFATDMDHKGRVVATVVTAHSGTAEVTCNHPGGWQFDVLSTEDCGRDVVTVRVSSPTNAMPPSFGVFFRVPGAGVQNVWISDYERDGCHLWPQLWWDWSAKYTSQLAKDTPIAVGFNSQEVAPVALACSEAFEPIEFGLYADDRTCEIVGRCEFFGRPTTPIREYSVAVMLDRRGRSFADTVRDCSQWVLNQNGFKPADVPKSAYDPLYSTWYAYLQDVHEKELEEEARLAAGLGMKTMILDDGWQKVDSASFYSATGDWQPVKSRFADMKSHVKMVHNAGLKYMLWLSVPYVGDESIAWNRFKDKMLVVHGKKSPGRVGVVDPRFPDVREYLISTYERVVGDWGFDGVKLDFIDQFALRGPDSALKDGYAGRDYRSVPEAVDRLMKDVLSRLKKINPDVLVEFRQHYMGPAILQYGNMMRCSDCPADPTANRKRVCDLRLTSGGIAVHSDMLVWSKDETPEGAALPILNVLFSTIQYSMILKTISPRHRDVIRHWLAFSQEHRDALLKGRFTPHHAENGYTWIEGESASERIVAAYANDVCVSAGTADRPVYLVNATGGTGMLVDFAAPGHVEFFDVFGNSSGETKVSAGVTRLPIPSSGYARVNWNSRPLGGKWISGGTASPKAPAPILERHFELKDIPRNAELTLAVAGWCEIKVNGRLIGDEVLVPTTCQPNLRISSLTRDISAYLKKGENVVAVLLGNGWYNCFTKEVWGFSDASWLGAPMICGELIADGQRLFETDGDWSAYDSPIVFNALRNGEWYDARKEGAGTNERPVTLVKYTPYAEISPEDASPCRGFDLIDPVDSFDAGDGGTIYDFGSNRSGWCEIEVTGEAGARVTIDYDECLTPTNTLLGDIGCFIRRAKDPRPVQHDEYTLSGKRDVETWHPRFTYHGFRYAQVRTYGKVELRRIRSVFVHSDLASVGSLKLSDPVFARLQDATRRSYLSNFVGIPTDCPHREKNGWTGDTQLAMESGLWNFDGYFGYVHFLRMMLDAQRPNGQVPCILPCADKFGFQWGSGPAYDAALFEIPWQLYRFYGDDAPAREAYEAMKRYLSYIGQKARNDGLVSFGLGDWCAPKTMKAAPVLLTDSAYVYGFNRRVAFWADRFGEPGVAARCREESERIRAAFNKEFYKGRGIYAGGELTSLAAPLYFKGLCAEGEERAVAAELVRRVRANGHRAWFGIQGAKWVPRVLSDYGYVGDAWRIFTQPEAPGWAMWMKDNDTLLESFDDTAGGTPVSHNHIMFGDLSAWAFEYLAGIKIDEPGFAKCHAEPYLPDGVDSFDISRRTKHGLIHVRAWREDGKPKFDIDYGPEFACRPTPRS